MSRTTDHHVISLFLGPIEEQPDGGFVRAIRWINRHGEESQLDLFAESGPGCLRLHSEAERRLDAYAQQAHESDPLLSPPREPLLSPVRRKTANCCECNGEYPAIDLHEGGEDRCPRCREQAREPYSAPTLTEYPLTTTDYALPETQGTVDLAAEANPPRFKVGDRVTPIKRKMYIGVIATVEDASPDGLYVRFTEGNRRWFPASLFRLADPDPLAEANPPMELPF